MGLLWKYILSVISAYLIGSISPSYFLGRLLKGIDIRQHGEGNAGTVNTYKVLGLIPAIITAIFDTSKGFIAALIAWQTGMPYPFNFAIAYAAVIGHVFPFYLQFRGGQGAATAVGIILYFLFRFVAIGSFPLLSLLILLLFVLSLSYVVRIGEIVGVFTLPALGFLALLHLRGNRESLIFLIFLLHVLIINLLNIHKKRIKLKPETLAQIKWARFFARPFAVLFIVIYFLTSRKTIVMLTASVALFFILLDLIRLSRKGINRFMMETLSFIFKSKEEHTFSSMTNFMISALLGFLLFPREIACAAILFPVFGDMFAKLFGLEYGRTRLYHKTLEGSIIYLSFSILAGYFYSLFTSFPYHLIIIGAVAATVAEALPWNIDDNLSGVLISGTAMHLFHVL